MNAHPDHTTRATPPPVIWWVIWGAILMGLVMIYLFLGRRPAAPRSEAAAAVIDYIGVGPLVLSSMIRWLWFPRIERAAPAFPIFIAGIALAEACGIMGIFLSAYATEFFALGVIGIAQWMPLFVGKYQVGAAKFR